MADEKDHGRGALTCDVLVVGAGLAGTTAALAAAESGARVTLASAGGAFSGSSAFGGTWGLGLVGPAGGAAGVDDLVDAVLQVGRGVAVPALARTLVRGVPAAVAELEARGVELTRAERADERDFIPCFDRSHRDWHGIVRASYREATLAAMARAGVRVLARHELQGLCQEPARPRRTVAGRLAPGRGGRVAGARFYDREKDRMVTVNAGAVVLATGGFGGLFSRTLTMPDVTGTAAAVALEAGARLINVEFIQIMPGLVAPVKDVVFNERTFKYAQVEGVEGAHAHALLDARSEHGPFSASLPDRVVDLALARAGAEGATVSYELPERLPEFMQTYFDWFSESFGRSPAEGVRILPYAHASNGGILVDERAETGVEGLFAAGEATGGMHGADRIGGLASANALVFGGIAGREAAAWAAGHPVAGPASGPQVDGGPGEPVASPEAGAVLGELRRTMDERCLVMRSEEGLRAAQEALQALDERLARSCGRAGSWAAEALDRRAELALRSARALTAAMLARRESRGAHFRADFPEADPAQARPLAVRLGDGGLPVAEPLG